MTKMRVLALAALALAAGCGSKSSDSGGGGDPACASAIDAGLTGLMESRKKAIDERLGSATDGKEKEARILERSQKVLDQLRGVLTTRCTEDKWSSEVTACISKVTKREEIQACIAKLPKELADRTNGDVMKAMTAGMRMRPPGDVPPGMHGMPPLGSAGAPPAMGSGAPAGSAAAPAGSAAAAPAPAPAGSAAK